MTTPKTPLQQSICCLAQFLLDDEMGITEVVYNQLLTVMDHARLDDERNEVARLTEATEGMFYVNDGALDHIQGE